MINAKYETGKQQLDASSLYILFIGNWQLTTRCEFNLRGFKTIKAKQKTGKRQQDVNSLNLVNWQLADHLS